MEDLRPHYTGPAVVSLIILALLLSAGFYLMFNSNAFSDKAVLQPASPSPTDSMADNSVVPADQANVPTSTSQ